MATVMWGEGGEARVVSIAELDQLLDDLAREAERDKPLIVELISDEGATLSVGLGHPERTVAGFMTSLDPPYLQSWGGDSTAEELVFYYAGSYSDYPPESGIPVDQAREALRRFFRTGALPDNIAWQET